ncbi:MAG: IS1 family transposase [Rhizobiales bacterium]|nr:IS1 family transposase [Hyphomicrobiales bacterium]MBI3673973.1 IS1 family transposase [Hyphomicrobiales bacterium]
MLASAARSSYIIGMDKLPPKARAQILNMLCEGSSMRSVSRLANVSINTVAKLLADAGKFCADFHDERVRNVSSQSIQVDEIWSFVYAKEANRENAKTAPVDSGDVWTWTALDADSKLIATWFVGDRTSASARIFLGDLKERVANRMQLTSDGHRAYMKAVDHVFGDDIDYAILHKIYGPDPSRERRYSPPVCVGAKLQEVKGNPNPKHISTSYAERSNLTMRMHNRRLTRLTNAFSKKFESHVNMIAIWTVWYNWVRIHKTLRVTPAMAAGLTDRLWSFEEMIAAMDEIAPKPGRPKTYNKR